MIRSLIFRRVRSSLFNLRFKWFILLVTACLLYLYSTSRSAHSHEEISAELRYIKSLSVKNNTNKGCTVPITNPWDPSILKYYKKQSPLSCSPVQDQLTTFENGVLKINKDLLDGRKCSIMPFYHSDGVSDFDLIYGNSTDLVVDDGYEFKIDHEFFEVNCEKGSYLARGTYKMHYAQVIPKNTSSVLKNKVKIADASIERPPVIILGLDSMSRGNFIRQMKKTYETMKLQKFVDITSHVKIGDNTYKNILALLTGKVAVTSKEFDAELPEDWGIAFDDIPMVFKNFSKEGYATFFAEDRPDIGTFTYLGKLLGFKTSPTDHYYRTYWLAAYWSIVSRRSSPFCYDTKGKHKWQLEYLEDFIQKYHKKRHFSLFWIQDMNHDYLNEIGQCDDDFNAFLENNMKYFDESIVFVLSDHGHRYDSIRETMVGWLESRLPFLSVRIGPKILSKYPHLGKILDENVNRLSTPFDLHETLNQIAAGTYTSIAEEPAKATERGYSLFKKKPLIRSCYEAWIPDDYCPCVDEVEIPASDAKEAADFLLKHVNSLLLVGEASEYDEEGLPVGQNKYQCLELQLNEIKSSFVRLPSTTFINNAADGSMSLSDGVLIQYRIVIQAKPPSNALIEGVVIKDVSSGKWIPSGEYERNNKYGNSSHCVTSPVLKKICHCILK